MKASKSHRPFLLTIALAAVRLLVLNVNPVTAQTSVTASADARIVEGVSVHKIADLEFGSMVATAEGGTVTINATTGQVVTTGVRHVHNSSCKHAEFKTHAEAQYHYSISLPRTIKLEHEKGKGSLIVTDFTCSDGAGMVNGNGQQNFNIGATLRVGPNQATGKYRGTFEVSIQHQ